MEKVFEAQEIEAIARALGHTEIGLTGSQIGHLLATCKMPDPDPALSKWKRIHNAFANKQNKAKNRRAILEFVRQALKPSRYIQSPERFEALRLGVNIALGFSGLAVLEDGSLVASKRVSTLSEAEDRARSLRKSLETRGIHPDVLECCRAELLADNYFYAVLEATKSIAEKICKRTGLTGDGAELVDHALAGSPPMLAINPLATPNEVSEQKGFANLLRGIFGMFRNPTAHALRISCKMDQKDAEDLLSMLSLIHRCLDSSHMPSRV
jgi:uncharacterized protein (TIGR02391 family)